MRFDLSRVVEFGVVKGHKGAHLRAIQAELTWPGNRQREMLIRALGSRDNLLTGFGLYIPVEDVRRFGNELIHYADQEGLP